MTGYSPRSSAWGEGADLVGDPQLPDGTYWRVALGPDRLAAGPALVYAATVRPYPAAKSGIGYRTNRAGDALGEVDDDSPLLVSVERPPGSTAVVGWIRVECDGELEVAALPVQGGSLSTPPVLTRRTAPPYLLACAEVDLVRITGHGVVHQVELLAVPGYPSEALGELVDLAALAREASDHTTSYHHSGGVGEDDWRERAERTAPRARAPHDARGPGAALPPDAEPQRVWTLSTGTVEGAGPGALSLLDWITAAYGVLEDPGGAVAVAGDDDEGVEFGPLDVIGTATVDPGIERFLGTAGAFRYGGGTDPDGTPELYVALLPVYSITPGSTADPGAVGQRYDQDTGGVLSAAVTDAHRFPAPRPRRHWAAELLAVPIPVARDVPPEVPPAPRPIAVSTAWESVGSDSTWSSVLHAHDSSPRGPISVVESSPGWRSLHPLIEDELAVLIAGRAATEPVASVVVTGITSSPPAGTSTVELRYGDRFGRWGEPGRVHLSPPPRPRPPAPLVEAAFATSAASSGGGGPSSASPGTIAVRVCIPAVETPGGLPVTRIRVIVEGEPVELPVVGTTRTGGGVLLHSVAAAPTTVGQTRPVTVRAVTVDEADLESAEASCPVTVTDPRSPSPPLVAPRLLVTTRRLADPTVSIELRVRAAPGAGAYRFLVASETLLRRQLGLPGDRHLLPRTVRAKQLADLGAGARDCYAAASDTPALVAGGVASALITVPRGTTDVVVVRAVPLTASADAGGHPVEGISGPLESVPPVFVIVPDSDVPPVPTLSLRADGAGRIIASVSLTGADEGILERRGGPVEVRLLVADDGAADPGGNGTAGDRAFWTPIGSAALTPSTTGTDGDGAPEHAARISLTAPAWSSVALAVSARYPAEPVAIPDSVPSASDITATGAQPDHVPSPWGPVSVPVHVQVPGPDAVVVPEDPVPGEALIGHIDALDTVPEGVPPWQLEVLGGEVVLETALRVAVTAASPDFTVAHPNAGWHYAAVLHDPFGRPRDPVTLPTISE